MRKRRAIASPVMEVGLWGILFLMAAYTLSCVISFVWYCFEVISVGFALSQIIDIVFSSFIYSFIFNQFWDIDLITILSVGSVLALVRFSKIKNLLKYVVLNLVLFCMIIIIYLSDKYVYEFLHDYQVEFYFLFITKNLIANNLSFYIMHILEQKH